MCGFDLVEPLDQFTVSSLEAAFSEYSVICFRNQNPSPNELIACARHYGEPQKLFLNRYAITDYLEIPNVSNIKENGQDIGYADEGIAWHSDMSFYKRSPRATILHAREVPIDRSGAILGDILFASVIKAYDPLSDEMKKRLEDLCVRHDVADNCGLYGGL